MKPLFGRYGVQEIPDGPFQKKWLWIEVTGLTFPDDPTGLHPYVGLYAAKERPLMSKRKPHTRRPTIILDVKQASTLAAALTSAVNRARKEQVVRKLELPL